MATARGKWCLDDLDKAMQEVKEHGLSIRKASYKYGIPRSTIHDHVTGKIERVRHGLSPVLTEEEESELVSWVIKMAEIGYGQTRIQVTEMVKKILDRTGRPNPFQDNCLDKDWWYMSLH